MTHDAEHTTSPQSVVVPVELAETPAIRNTLGLLRSALLCGEQWSDTCRDAYLAALRELDQLAMLAAAPAPSSLAGGEEAEFATALARVLDRHGLRDAGWADAAIDEALSVVREPSAVSRATVDAILPMISERLAALTPRHEAPAEGAGEAASAARALLDACYKADENSDLSDFVDGMLLTRLDKALRARSSAPEAREGEAPFGYWVEHKAGNSPMFIPYGSFIPASDNYKITKLYTHPAAPSADKLRIAVEALEPFAAFGDFEAEVAVQAPDANLTPDDSVFKHWSDAFGMKGPRLVYADLRRASYALAALKAERA